MAPQQDAPATTPDKSAAHDFLVELRTRIAIQPLPYRAGVEAGALKSLFELFGHARAAMKKYPGCAHFADRVAAVLNEDVRPVTAKWHRGLEAGRLQSRDGSDEFRADLKQLQEKLRDFAGELHQMAYGRPDTETLTAATLDQGIVDHLTADMPFRIDPDRSPKGAEINASEKLAIEMRRRKVFSGMSGVDLANNAVGVALSGGGIRSATFSLGAMQVLAARGLFKDVDFLSTVSGGGYTGSFLTTTLVDGPPPGCTFDTWHHKLAGPYGPDSGPVRHIRQHAKYLMTSGLTRQWSMVAGALAGLLLNWTAPIGLIAAVALGVTCLSPHWPFGWVDLFIFAGMLSAFAFILFAVGLRHPASAGPANVLLAGAVGLTVLLAAAWTIQFVRDHVHDWNLATLFGLSAATASAGPLLIRFLPFLKKPIVRTTALTVLLYLAGVVLPLSACVLFYLFLSLGNAQPWLLAAIVVVCAVCAVSLLNINKTAPYQLYRGFLSKTFVEGKDSQIPELSALGCAHGAPYHLLNAAVNLPSSQTLTVRDRKTDFFLFSPEWCGGPTVGYWPTREWKTDGRPLDLSTAMAVSGAAFSTHMGLASMPTLTAMLTLLNVRLGFWLRKPPESGGWPGFLCLLREMTGFAMSEQQSWINLSDGGHIENLGVYELLRRRCKFVVCVDGEADPAFSFHGLMTVVRHAQIDLGVRIDPRLDDLRLSASTQCCKTHYALCRVHYPATDTSPAGIGLLLYVKLSLTGNETELIQRYRLVHQEFPHQSTLDQFFDEEQFEAYRQLGVHVMDGLFSPALVGTEPMSGTRDWFRRLAANLLEPLSEEQAYAIGRPNP